MGGCVCVRAVCVLCACECNFAIVVFYGIFANLVYMRVRICWFLQSQGPQYQSTCVLQSAIHFTSCRAFNVMCFYTLMTFCSGVRICGWPSTLSRNRSISCTSRNLRRNSWKCAHTCILGERETARARISQSINHANLYKLDSVSSLSLGYFSGLDFFLKLVTQGFLVIVAGFVAKFC